jgi:hypothetical protein
MEAVEEEEMAVNGLAPTAATTAPACRDLEDPDELRALEGDGDEVGVQGEGDDAEMELKAKGGLFCPLLLLQMSTSSTIRSRISLEVILG